MNSQNTAKNKLLVRLILTIAIILLGLLLLPSTVRAEGTRDMYDWTNYSNTNGENDRWFYYYDETNTSAGLVTDTVIKVYANEGETVKLATSGTGFRITTPDNETSTVSVTQSNGAVGFINNANQERNKTYTYYTFTADQTGIYSIKLLQSRAQASAGVNGDLGIRNINSGETSFTSFQTVAYIAAWDVQIENSDGEEINGRVWQDYVNIYRGYGRSNNNSKGNVDYYILTDDGYTYKMNCRGMDPGGMSFFIGTRGLISKSTNEIVYRSISDSEVNGSVLMPVPSNGGTEFDSYGKIFYNKPSEDLPLSIKREPNPTTITEELTFNEASNRGESHLAGIFSFSVSDACVYSIKIKKKDTGEVVRVLNSAAVTGKNTIIWDGKNSSGNYVGAGEYSGILEVRNGEYHFILNDVETIYTGITIKSEDNGDSTVYYNNSSLGGANISTTGQNSETTPFKYNTNFGDHKLINVWTYNNVQSNTDFFVMDEYDGTRCVLKGRVFFDANNDRTFNGQDSPISDVKIKITNTDTNEVVYATTATNGEFFYNVLKNATYRIEVSEESKNTKLYTYTNTTNNETQTRTISTDTTVGDIGYFGQNKNIIVQKIWDDFDNAAGFRPSSINIKVFAGDTEVGTYPIKASNGWVGTISLPKYSGNTEITYRLEEEEISPIYKLENATIVNIGNIYTVTNVAEIPEDKAVININKVWEDEDNLRNVRPTSISGTITPSVGDPIQYTITQNDNWTKKFVVDKYDSNNELITYSITEDDVTGYTKQITNKDYDYTITNTITERVSIIVNKQWQDYTETTRPASVTVKLMNGEEVAETKILTAESNWLVTFNTAEKYDSNGDLIVYDVVEDDVLGYELKEKTRVADVVVLTNKKVEIVSMTINKTWDDNDDKNHLRPSSITVDIRNKATNENVKTGVRLTEENGWTATVEGLKKYDDDDNIIEYIVKELEISNYVQTQNEITVGQDGNMVCDLGNAINVVQLSLKKTWDDNDNSAGKRPEELRVTVKNGSDEVETVTLKASEEWKKIVGPYDKYDSYGEEIEYSVQEENVEFYTLQEIAQEEVIGYKELQFTPSSWSKRADGTWESTNKGSSNSTASLQSEQFTITRPVVLEFDWACSSEGNSYDYLYYTITDKTTNSTIGGVSNKIGENSSYDTYATLSFKHVSQVLNPGTYVLTFYYRKDSSVNSGLDQGFVKNAGFNDTSAANADVQYTLTNKFEVPDDKTSYTVEKYWDDDNNVRGKRPDSITIGLYANGILQNEYELTASGEWTKYIGDLPVYDENADVITYSIKETNTNSILYTIENATVTEMEPGKVSILNKYERPQDKINLELKKTWDDNDNSEGKRPDSITVNLYGDGTLVSSYELTASENWEKQIDDIYKYDDEGNEITYTVDENTVSMYRLSGTPTKTKKTLLVPIEFDLTASSNWVQNTDGTYNSTNQYVNSSTAVLKSKPFTVQAAGMLEFDWVVSSEANYDFLWYEVKNENQAVVTGGYNNVRISGTSYGVSYSNLNFLHKTLLLNAGTYTIEFTYSKDSSSQSGLDRGYVKNAKVTGEIDSSLVYTLNNTYVAPVETTSLIINKVWDDNNNENNRRPSEVVVGLYEDGTKRNTYTLSASENWTKTIDGLAKTYPNGDTINYSVVEESTGSVFYKPENATISEIENNTVTITNKYAFPDDKKTLTVEKIWNDNDNAIGKRPDEVEIGLLANNVEQETYTIEASDNWSKVISDLPVYDSEGAEIVYTVEETNTNSNLYDLTNATVSDIIDGKITITNTLEIPDTTVDYTINKEWVDNNDENSKRPSSLTVVMYENGTKTQEIELKASENWTKELTGLPEYDTEGNKIEYDFVEDFNNRFYKRIATLKENNVITFRNKYETPSTTTNLTVEKVWDDNDNEAGKRPESITVEVYANDVATGTTHELTASENWSYTFTNLARYDGSGNEIDYTVEETVNSIFYREVSNSKYDDTVTITNEFSIPQEYINIVAVKVWDDDNNAAGKRPESVTVSLYANGTKQADYTLTEANYWQHSFDFYQKYDHYGDEIVYTVTEDLNNSNYSLKSNETVDEGRTKTITLTNQFAINKEKTDITVEKIWDDNNDEAGKRPTSVTINLKNGNNLVGTEVLNDTNNWTSTFNNIPKYDNYNDEIDYTAEEVVNSNFYSQTGNTKTNNKIEITNKFVVPDDTIDVEVTKVWDDKENKAGKRPNEITVILKDSLGEEVDRAEISGSDISDEGWTYTFASVQKYDSYANIINYSVDEIGETDLYSKAINGYTIVNTCKLNDSSVVNPKVEKTGTEKIKNTTEAINYGIDYKASIEKFYGKAIVTIVDFLPYEIDEDGSFLNNGIYDASNKTITWTEELDNIDTFTDGTEEVSIQKYLVIKYKNIENTVTSIKNYVTVDITLENTDIEEKVDGEYITKIEPEKEETTGNISEIEEPTPTPDNNVYTKNHNNPKTNDDFQNNVIVFVVAIFGIIIIRKKQAYVKENAKTNVKRKRASRGKRFLD